MCSKTKVSDTYKPRESSVGHLQKNACQVSDTTIHTGIGVGHCYTGRGLGHN